MSYNDQECLTCYLGYGGNNPCGVCQDSKGSVCFKCIHQRAMLDLDKFTHSVRQALTTAAVIKDVCLTCDVEGPCMSVTICTQCSSIEGGDGSDGELDE